MQNPLLQKAFAAFQNKQYLQVQHLLTHILQHEPDNPWGWHLKGLIALEQGNAQGYTDLDKALGLAPTLGTLWINSALAALRRGELPQARRYLLQALQQGVDSAQLYLYLGDISRKTQQESEARQYYLNALQREPENPQALEGLQQLSSLPWEERLAWQARLLARQERWQEAQQILQTLPEEQAELSLLRARVSVHLGEREKARRWFLAALAQTPTDQNLKLELATFYRDMGQAQPALEILDQILAESPDQALAHHLSGQAFLIAGQAESSRDHFRQARRLSLSAPHYALQSWQQKLRFNDFKERALKKIQHDIEQIDYWRRQQIPTGLSEAELERWQQDYRMLQTQLNRAVPLTLELSQRLDEVFNRYSYIPEPTWEGPVLNPDLPEDLPTRFLHEIPRCVSVDHFLSPSACQSLYRYCLEATIWQNYLHGYNYLCAYPQDGFNPNILYVLNQELRERYPQLFSTRTLRKFWVYKYDSSKPQGVQLHADGGSVNVNFWLTPDTGCLNPESSGVILYEAEAPLFATEREFSRFNRRMDSMQALLAQTGYRCKSVAHRQNRAVIFNANLLHETGQLFFRPEYPFRRINMTLVFGDRGQS